MSIRNKKILIRMIILLVSLVFSLSAGLSESLSVEQTGLRESESDSNPLSDEESDRIQSDEDDSAYIPVQSENISIPVVGEDLISKYELPDNEAIHFIKELKTGWNLGNTFDAYNDINRFLGLKLETHWSQAKTTRELIHALKAAGFNLIRIPVSWHNHIIDEDYTIDPQWMKRVLEVASWISEEGMYFIVNIHHDNDKKYFYPSSAYYEQSEKYLTAVWSQIAEAFSGFDDHCILESMNEPRLVGHAGEWTISASSADHKDAAQIINKLNQKFVDLVRSTGGNNASRYLCVPGYCASPDGALNALFQVPSDTADNRIIIAVHAYTPYDFALKNDGKTQSFDLQKDRRKKSEIDSFMNSLYRKYIKAGIPVLIDEFGALLKGSDDLQQRVNFTAYYVAAASARGMTCCWWDNNAFTGSGEKFGLIDRKTVQWRYPDIALAMIRNCLYNRE